MAAVNPHPRLQTYQCLRYSSCFFRTHFLPCLIQRPILNIFYQLFLLPCFNLPVSFLATWSRILIPSSAFGETQIKMTGYRKVLVLSLGVTSFFQSRITDSIIVSLESPFQLSRDQASFCISLGHGSLTSRGLFS